MQRAASCRSSGWTWALVAAACALLATDTASAGEPRAWQVGLQEAASPVMERIADLNLLLTVTIVGTTALVVRDVLGSERE